MQRQSLRNTKAITKLERACLVRKVKPLQTPITQHELNN